MWRRIMKNKAKNVKNEFKTIIESFTELIEAISLIIVSGFAVYQGRQSHEFWAWPVLIAGAVIAVRGGLEFIKYLKKRG